MMTNRNTKLPQDLAQNEGIINWFEGLRRQLLESNQRALVLLTGPRNWCLQSASSVMAGDGVLLSNDTTLQQAVVFSKAHKLLGQEVDCVVFDLFSGINSDVLCMAAGLLCSKGVLILIAPADLDLGDDPYGCWQSRQASSAEFLRYLLDQWSGCANFFRIIPDQALPAIGELPCSPEASFSEGLTEDQHGVMQQLEHWSRDASKSFALLTADRGRGKSTILGKFANSLKTDARIVVTAASRVQVKILWQQLDDQTGVVFMAPDEIIRSRPRIDLLVIDEAAMLPASMLQQCMEYAQKTLLATTTGGYEGTGQGFLLKFIAGFDTEQLLNLQLNQAVRWGQNDLLEQCINDAMVLSPPPPRPYQQPQQLSFEQISRTQLNSDRQLLSEVYGLLVSAHYRTRPSDLRQLMEDENQLLLLARDGTAVLAVLLLNREGGFDLALSEQVLMGRRRPQGHLLAQMMTAQAGVKHFCHYQGYRVQRIAVEQNYRRMGLGKKLIQMASDLVVNEQLDYLGSSFALDPANAAFWKSCGFQLMHLSAGQGKSSGRQTVAVLKTQQQELSAQIQTMHNRLQQDLPLLLLTYANAMYWKDVLALLKLANFACKISPQDDEIIRAFAYGFYGLDYALTALQRFLVSNASALSRLDSSTQRIMIEKLLLNYSWQRVLCYSEFSGRKPLLQYLRENIRILYEYTNTP